VASGSFVGDRGVGYSVDLNSHTYEIYWTNSKAWWLIDGILIHTSSGTAAPLVSVLSLKIGAQSQNATAAVQSDNVVSCRALTISRLGQLTTQPVIKYITTSAIQKRGPGNLHGITVSGQANGAAVMLYDALSAVGGTELCNLTFAYPNTPTIVPVSVDLKGAPFSTGLYVAITGTPKVSLIFE
jgi:hypothetical protein